MSNVERPFVLLIDDNEATCTLIKAVLHRDFTVDVAADGQDAMERLRTKHYAAIILDLRMPQADGFSVLEFLQENDPRTLRSVLVVTAALTATEMARTKTFDVCSIISKPFDPEEIARLVVACADIKSRGPFGAMAIATMLAGGPFLAFLNRL